MMVGVAYDVDTTDKAGARRLRKVAQLCEKNGVRVQNSVFEVLLDAAQLTALKCALEKVIDPEADSVRFYRLGNSYTGKIEIMGKAAPVQMGEPLIFNADPARTKIPERSAQVQRQKIPCFVSF